MSCMAALPDGTFLIVNGAHAGVAGFGLGADPNLNAVLYDPANLGVPKHIVQLDRETVEMSNVQWAEVGMKSIVQQAIVDGEIDR